LAFTTAPAQRPRFRTVAAGDLTAVIREIADAKVRFHVAADTPVRSCYEAGRDGFWVHRWLTARGIDNLVVDSSSIEVPRRARRAKTDRLDVTKLLSQLQRAVAGEPKVWSGALPGSWRMAHTVCDDVTTDRRSSDQMVRVDNDRQQGPGDDGA
jgi:transposase